MSSDVKNYVVNFDWLKGDAMGTLITNSFLFGEEAAMVTYDDETMDVLTWATKDHHGNFIPGTKLNYVNHFRLTVDERKVLEFDVDGDFTERFCTDDVCEQLYRMYVGDNEIKDGDWAYINVLSPMPIRPDVLERLGAEIRQNYQRRYGGDIHVALNNVDVYKSPAKAVVLYASDEQYIIADRQEAIVKDGSFGGSVFGNSSTHNSVYGTVESDLAELSKALYRIRRNPDIHILEVDINDDGIIFSAIRDPAGKYSTALSIVGDKFKLGN